MKILIIGGNRFFGKKLAGLVTEQGHDVTILSRGNVDDGFGDKVRRIKCDRNDKQALLKALGEQTWDIVYDQVCFDYDTAKASCEIFKDKVAKYIFTSSQSVCHLGKDLCEEIFDGKSHNFEKKETMTSDYAEAKRQAEAGFAKHAAFPVVSVRFPVVMGLDDYTKRLTFHIDRVKQGLPIYFPNIEAKMSFVTSDFAAESLAFLGQQDFEGPINVASPNPIRLRDLVGTIEQAVGKTVNLTDELTDENHSPYGIDSDWYMDCGRLKNLGLVGAEITEWLPELLR